MTLVIIPFLTNSLIRMYGWIVLLRKYGVINQILNGTVPNVNSNSSQSQDNSMQSVPNLSTNMANNYDENDKMLCQDALSTEKFISSTYNTAIFEFKDKNIRQVLNHIQKEECDLKISLLYLSTLQETQELVSNVRHLLRASKRFQE